MRITHAILQNCRVHSRLQHDFSPGLNLIGGDNESGKSTLVEAMHRALFLRSKGSTVHHRALVPTTGGVPEVELGIESAGRRLVLRKRFGSNGLTTFASQDAAQQMGPEAEEALESIVGPAASGQQLEERWAHLWVWQGQSSNDPSRHTTAQRDELLARLQHLGGAAILQSGSDTRLAQQFADEAQRWFVSGGRPRTDSTLGRANKELEEAEANLGIAEARWSRLESAHRDHEAAIRAIAQSTRALEALQSEEARCADRQRQLTVLRNQENNGNHQKSNAENNLNSARATELRLKQISTDIHSLETEASQRTRRLEEARTSAQAARDALSQADEQLATAERAVHQSLSMRDIASTEVEVLEISDQLDRVRNRAETAKALGVEISAKEASLASLPALNAKSLRILQKKHFELGEARASVQAMATGLTLVASTVPIQVDHQPLVAGQSAILTEETLIEVGDLARLRIQPGGGSTLEDTRARARNLEAELQAGLRALGLQTIAEAEEALNRRRDLDQDLAGLNGRSQELGTEQITKESADLEKQVAESKALLARLVGLAGEEMPSRSLEDARSHLARQKSDHEALEGSSRGVRTARAEAATKRDESDRYEREMGQLFEAQRSRLDSLRGQLELLVHDHGDDATRARHLEQAQEEVTTAEAGLRTTLEAIERLQPDLLSADQDRLQRVRQEQTDLLARSREQAATARGGLIADGVRDPASDLSSAKRRKEQAQEQAREQRRHGAAISLLDQLFKEEQQHLSTQFTRPLADRLNGYLRCLFGPRAQAQVDLTEGEFHGLRLLRPEYGQSPLPFDTLSGGAREQVGAALRLAVAELLASGGDGTLPVVFDDAFAFTDPDRVNGMHRMLDRAARQGLQILVMTCNPANYSALGARQLILTRGQPTAAPAPPDSNPATNAASDALRNSRVASEWDFAGIQSGGEAQPTHPDANSDLVANPGKPTSRPDEALLLEVLARNGGSAGNQTLRRALGWSEANYEAVRSTLIARGRLVTGRGRGGSVAIPTA